MKNRKVKKLLEFCDMIGEYLEDEGEGGNLEAGDFGVRLDELVADVRKDME